jgi:hypothetical protein
MVLRTNRTDRLVAMITTSDLITHRTAKTTRKNAPAMIAADNPHEIVPTPRCPGDDHRNGALFYDDKNKYYK